MPSTTNNPRTGSRNRRLGLALAAGVLWGVCWLPTGMAPFLPLAFFLVLRGLRHIETPRQAVWFGVVFGVTRYAVSSHFLLVLGKFGPLGFGFYPAAILYFLPFAILESWGAFQLERLLRIPRAVTFGLLYVLLEYFRTLSDLSFPADLMAHCFGTWPQWLALTPWTGPYGLTLMILLCAIALDLALAHRRSSSGVVALAVAILIWSTPVIVDGLPALSPDRNVPALHVAILQPVIGVEEKMDRAAQPSTWKRLEQMTLEAAAGPLKPDLIVWPESTRPAPVTWRGQGAFRDDRMQRLAEKAGAPILYGTVIARVMDDRLKALYNGAALVFPDDRPAQWYGKQRLLPLAEKVPFRSLFGIDPYASDQATERKNILSMLGRFLEGPVPTLFEIDGMRFGVLICYEGMYPALSRTYRSRGANAIVILTNDAWWGHSAFAPWHAQMVSSISRELSLPVIRAANSGISSHTDVSGRQLVATPLDARTTVHLQVTPGAGQVTFYTRWGHLIPFGLMLLCCLIYPGIRKLRKGG